MPCYIKPESDYFLTFYFMLYEINKSHILLFAVALCDKKYMVSSIKYQMRNLLFHHSVA